MSCPLSHSLSLSLARGRDVARHRSLSLSLSLEDVLSRPHTHSHTHTLSLFSSSLSLSFPFFSSLSLSLFPIFGWQEEGEEKEFENGWECGYNSYLNALEVDVRVQQARSVRLQQLPDADASSTDAAARYFQQGFQQG